MLDDDTKMPAGDTDDTSNDEKETTEGPAVDEAPAAPDEGETPAADEVEAPAAPEEGENSEEV